MLLGHPVGGRAVNHTDLLSMLVANARHRRRDALSAGAARRLLPFPDTPGLQFHDHWLALAALATGDIAYVDRPLYDYVQHAGAVFGEVVTAPTRAERRGRSRRGGVLPAATCAREVAAADAAGPRRRRSPRQAACSSASSPRSARRAPLAWLARPPRPRAPTLGERARAGRRRAVAAGGRARRCPRRRLPGPAGVRAAGAAARGAPGWRLSLPSCGDRGRPLPARSRSARW